MYASNRCVLCFADTYVVTGCFCIYELNMQLSLQIQHLKGKEMICAT
jgi:hypothetical protein